MTSSKGEEYGIREIFDMSKTWNYVKGSSLVKRSIYRIAIVFVASLFVGVLSEFATYSYCITKHQVRPPLEGIPFPQVVDDLPNIHFLACRKWSLSFYRLGN